MGLISGRRGSVVVLVIEADSPSFDDEEEDVVDLEVDITSAQMRRCVRKAIFCRVVSWIGGIRGIKLLDGDKGEVGDSIGSEEPIGGTGYVDCSKRVGAK